MKKVIQVLFICISLASSSAFAATINGSFGITGEYSATGGSDLSDATTLDLVTVTAIGFGTGDINGDGNVDQIDLDIVMKVLIDMPSTGIRSDYILSNVDVNGDNKIGVKEAIYILGIITGVRE